MLWLIRLRYNFIDSVAISAMVLAFTRDQYLLGAITLLGGITLSVVLTLIHINNCRTKPMTYNDLGITISITLGQRASAALNSKNHLLIVQDQGDNGHAVIDLGPLTEARVKELGEYLQRLVPHSA